MRTVAPARPAVLPTEAVDFAITLYVPDVTAQLLRAGPGRERLLAEGTTELAFLLPGWWEGSHTVRLGLLRRGDAPIPTLSLERRLVRAPPPFRFPKNAAFSRDAAPGA
jgi:hypothetical protein